MEVCEDCGFAWETVRRDVGARTARGAVAVMLVLFGAACGSSHNTGSPTTNPAGSAAQRHALAVQYLAIAKVGNAGLDRAFNALDGADHNDLVAARADWRGAAATERQFDRSLLALALPPSIEVTAQAVVRVNEARAKLADAAGVATSLARLRVIERSLAAANETVVREVRILRKQLGLPPAETS